MECGREREYLPSAEIERLIKAAGSHGRHLHRDATLILLCYRHGLRVSELVALKWSQVELKAARLHVKRAKGSIDGVHPLTGRELRALRKLQREQPAAEHLFMSERGSPMAPVAAQKVVRQAGERAGFGFHHPHPYAAALVRLCPHQSRHGRSHAAGVAWTCQHSQHRHLYPLGCKSVQFHVERLNKQTG